MPVAVPQGVEISLEGNALRVKGPRGELRRSFLPQVAIEQKENELIVSRDSDEPFSRAIHGTTRALIQNMVTGVTTGFTKTLQVEGVGYRAELKEKNLVLYVGYSHPVELEPPAGIEFAVDTTGREIRVSGYDKELVGLEAANVRKVRAVEPYKGKGIHYAGEVIRRKAGKAAKGAKK
jgi:large subunit ribosomal protein L6